MVQLSRILAASGFIVLSLAADCSGTYQPDLEQKFGDAFWAVRQEMCSNSESCPYQQNCNTFKSQTTSGYGTSSTINVNLQRIKTGSQHGFPDCWVSVEKIMKLTLILTGFNRMLHRKFICLLRIIV